MTTSILTSTKKVLGIDAEYQAYDVDIIMHINTVFANLQQIGVGPSAGFEIVDDKATWEDYIGTDTNLNAVKTYMFLRVKLVFDRPDTSFAIQAMQEQIQEQEWRLCAYAEEKRNQ
jgi:hypothetical protein